MKKYKKIFPLLFFLLFALFPVFVFASFTYTPMEKIPIFGSSPDFCEYLTFIYKFGVASVGISALVMIAIGGFMYSTSAGNNASMEKAKGVISDALIGLIIALTAYLLISIINPDLTICTIPTTAALPMGGGAAAATGKTPEEIACEESAQTELTNAGININNSYCATDASSNCTDLCNGEPGTQQDLIAVMKKLNAECGITMITGATEKSGHTPGSKHYIGKAIDMRATPEQTQCLIDKKAVFGVYQVCGANGAPNLGCSSYKEPAGIAHITLS